MTNTKDNLIPQSLDELAKWMKRECFNENSYAIGRKNAPYEGFVLDRKNGEFEWFYTERGKKDLIKTFKSEEDACRYAFEQMKNDKFARSHPVAAFEDEEFQKQLCRDLDERQIEYRVGKILYTKEKFRYFVNVFGCDHKKVKDIKEKYKKHSVS